MKEIKTHIAKDGTTTIETSGFKGTACKELTDKILRDLEALGIPTGNRDEKKKAEYYAQSSTGIKTNY